MSGGSLGYLYCKEELDEMIEALPHMEDAEEFLKRNKYDDISMDVRRLIEYILTAENRIRCLSKQLSPVFKAVEWYMSGDWGEERLKKELEKYRSDSL